MITILSQHIYKLKTCCAAHDGHKWHAFFLNSLGNLDKLELSEMYTYQQLRSLVIVWFTNWNRLLPAAVLLLTQIAGVAILPAMNVDILCTNSDRPTFGGDLFNERCSRKQKLVSYNPGLMSQIKKAFVGLMMGREDTSVVHLNDGFFYYGPLSASIDRDLFPLICTICSCCA